MFYDFVRVVLLGHQIRLLHKHFKEGELVGAMLLVIRFVEFIISTAWILFLPCIDYVLFCFESLGTGIAELRHDVFFDFSDLLDLVFFELSKMCELPLFLV